MTRREQAIAKIRRLERRLEITKTQHALDKIEREINRLQYKYGITMEEIRPVSLAEALPWLPESVRKLLEGK